jgi:hypothetical protein
VKCRLFFYFFALVTLLLSADGICAELTLYRCEAKIEPVANYNQLVGSVVSGDRITFCNGQVFTVEDVLGSGTNTKVLAIKENPDLVLRIPLSDQSSARYSTFDLPKGSLGLEQASFPVIRSLQYSDAESSLSQPGESGRGIQAHLFSARDEYVLQERVREPFVTMYQLVAGSGETSPEERREAIESLREFAKEHFNVTGIYLKKSRKWAALDYGVGTGTVDEAFTKYKKTAGDMWSIFKEFKRNTTTSKDKTWSSLFDELHEITTRKRAEYVLSLQERSCLTKAVKEELEKLDGF